MWGRVDEVEYGEGEVGEERREKRGRKEGEWGRRKLRLIKAG